MSRARFGPGSGLYLYDDVGGYVCCCMCALVGGSVTLRSVDEALAHVAAHRAAGHDVPPYVEEELEAERAELTAWLDGERTCADCGRAVEKRRGKWADREPRPGHPEGAVVYSFTCRHHVRRMPGGHLVLEAADYHYVTGEAQMHWARA